MMVSYPNDWFAVAESQSVEVLTRDRPGDIIAGKYRLEHVLGRGGMGTVWRARNLALDSPVAIKVLSSAVDSPGLRERLLVEAQASAKLAHPAIVKVFDVAETERGQPCIVMELLSGTSLGTLLAHGKRLPATRVVQLLLPIVDALRLAHNKGLIHRDVKPDNVFIVDDDSSAQPKLVDFGIVKVEREQGGSNLTRAGDVMGSPDYMSPEQARGDAEITLSSDIWSLCVVLYEAVAGCPPFSGRNYNALLREIVETQARTLHELGIADEDLSAIVAKGLSKQPRERFSSMRDLGRALAEWLLRQGITEDVCGTAIETKWVTKSVVGDDASGPWSDATWIAEAPSGLRPKLSGRTPVVAGTIAGVASLRQGPRGGWKWIAAGVAISAAGVVAYGATTRGPSELHSAVAARPAAALPIRSLPAAAPVASPTQSQAVVQLESLALEDPVTPEKSPDEADVTPQRPTQRARRPPPAPRKSSKRKKDLLNPY
jgi:eukaryotic-like serine/threonine-protein kinase